MTDDQIVSTLNDNSLGKIPNRKNEKFEPKKIFHIVVQAEIVNGNELEFFVHPPPDGHPEIVDENTIVEYVSRMAKVDIPPVIRAAPSPLDIAVKEQCWVIVHLGASIGNWQFTPGVFGCTTKAKENNRNLDLVHAYKGGTPIGKAGEVINGDGCKLLYFGVRKRGLKNSVDPANPGSDGFNFHVEIVQGKGTSLEKRLPLIFDPDVKNDSDTNTIPPDGG